MQQRLLVSYVLILCSTDTFAGRCHFGCLNNDCSTHGVCTKECKQGYSGYRCDNCLFCVGQYCSDTGVCSLGCIEGQYGSRCDQQCPAKCLPNTCYRVTGDCMKSCEDGYYGSRCDEQCPEHCTRCSSNNHSDVYCISCSQGYYGRLCEMSCSRNCLFNKCGFKYGECTYGCNSVRYYGNSCDKICTMQNSSSCYYKCHTECRNKCPANCVHNRCESASGACSFGCSTGYHGPLCNRQCPRHCISCQQNLQSRHECISCDAGYYGPTCEYKCSNCHSNVCNQKTGNCTKGCAEGYYDTGCSNQCPAHCLTCDRDFENTTICTVCKQGYYGASCKRPCPLYCINNTCSRKTGDCYQECKDGHNMRINCAEVSGANDVNRCPPNIARNLYLHTHAGRCYQFNLKDKRWWSRASSHCAQQGGTLITIERPDIQAFMEQILTNITGDEHRLWIGATDARIEQDWKWETGQNLSDGYTNWKELPSCNYHRFLCREDCALLYLEEGYKWDQSFCSANSFQYGFVCQFEMLPEVTTSISSTSRSTTTSTATTIKTTVQTSIANIGFTPPLDVPTTTIGVNHVQEDTKALNKTWSIETGNMAVMVALVVVTIILAVTIICVVLRCKRTRHASALYYLTPVRNANEVNDEGRRTDEMVIENANQSNEEVDTQPDEVIAGHLYMPMDVHGYVDIHRHQSHRSSGSIERMTGQPWVCEADDSKYMYEPIDLGPRVPDDTTYETIV